MRSTRRLTGLVLLAAAAGCNVDEPLSPTPTSAELKLRVIGDPHYLTGKVTVLFDAPAGSVGHVELDLRGATVGAIDEAPYSFDLDSTACADGPAQLTAKATLTGSGAVAGAALDVDLANAAPKLLVSSPADGETVLGSPSHGFTIHPVISAVDGNSIASVWADLGKGPVDLGKADGTTPLLLDSVGTDFPQDPVAVTFHARDTTGAESAVTIKVVPSNVKVRFEQPTAGAVAPLVTLDLLSDGRPLLGFSSSYYLLPEPSRTAKPSLTLDLVDSLTRTGDSLFYTVHDADQKTESLMFSKLGGPAKALFQLSSAKQATAFDPFLRASGHICTAWVDSDTLQSHVLGYTPEGVTEFDTLHTGSPLLDQIVETSDGRMLTVASQSPLVSFVQPLDGATGAELPPWAPPGGQFLLVDDQGVVVIYYTTKAYGTPAIHLASFDLAGTQQWDELVDETYPQLARRLPDGSALVYLFGAGVGVPSSLTVIGKAGQTALWTGSLEESDFLMGPSVGSTDLLVSRFNTTTSTLSAMRLSEAGKIVWVTPLPGDANAATQVLSDGSVLASAPDATAKTVTNALISPDGKPQWTATFPGEKVLGALEADDLLIFASSGGDMAPFRFEARRRATGELSWRHVEGPSPDVFGRWVMGYSKPWNAAFGSLVRAKTAPSGTTYTTVTLGFIP